MDTTLTGALQNLNANADETQAETRRKLAVILMRQDSLTPADVKALPKIMDRLGMGHPDLQRAAGLVRAVRQHKAAADAVAARVLPQEEIDRRYKALTEYVSNYAAERDRLSSAFKSAVATSDAASRETMAYLEAKTAAGDFWIDEEAEAK